MMLKSWIREIEIVNSWSWNSEFVNSVCWKHEFKKMKSGIHKVEMSPSVFCSTVNYFCFFYFSADGNFYCVANIISNGYDYTTVYNRDSTISSTTNRFACLVRTCFKCLITSIITCTWFLWGKKMCLIQPLRHCCNLDITYFYEDWRKKFRNRIQCMIFLDFSWLFSFMNSRSWNREFVKLKSWIHKVEIVNSRSWIRELEIVNSWSWNREFFKLKSWIHEV
jgi:hypothetical protein